jgi:hypothetical protein
MVSTFSLEATCRVWPPRTYVQILILISGGKTRSGEVVALVAALMVEEPNGNLERIGVCDAVALLTSLCSWPETSVGSTTSMVSPLCTQCDCCAQFDRGGKFALFVDSRGVVVGDAKVHEEESNEHARGACQETESELTWFGILHFASMPDWS